MATITRTAYPVLHLWRMLLAALMAAVLFHAAHAQARSEQLAFPRGAAELTVEDRITGRESIEYTLRASAGQTMRVSLSASIDDTYFDIIAPNGVDTLFEGIEQGGRASVRLTKSGTHIVTVYLGRTAARRGETSSFRLNVRITGDVDPPPPPPKPDPGQRLSEVFGVKAGDRLNMRTGPGTSYRVIDSFTNGTILRNYGCATAAGGGEWCEVSRDQRGAVSGWVSSRFLRNLRPTNPKPDPKPEPPPQVTGSVQCALLLPVFKKSCPVTLTRTAKVITLKIRRVEGLGTRTLIFDGRKFTSPDGVRVEEQFMGDSYLVIANKVEFFMVPVRLFDMR